MHNFWKKVNRWLLPTVLCTFLALALMLPLVAGYAYAGRSNSPDHVLTYTEGHLTWDSGKNIRPDGTAEMELFFPEYDDSVKSGNGDDIAAPGTGEDYFVRLQNAVDGPITYTAVLYEIKSDERIPLEVRLTGEDLTPTTTYYLPEGVSADMVRHAVTGTVQGHQVQDFDVDWAWEFYVSQEQDAIDTALGNKFVPDEMTVGLYIVVEDDNDYTPPTEPTEPTEPTDPTEPTEPTDPTDPTDPTEPGGGTIVTPDNPQTGDESPVAMYVTLLIISGVLLILMLLDRRKEKEAGEY